MQGVLEPGHGPFSSLDERSVAVVALIALTLAGALLEYVRDAEGWGVLGAAVGVVVAFVVAAPPILADEWHYVFVAAIPVLIAVRFYRGRGE